VLPRPVRLPGGGRWQLETVAPRGVPHALAFSPDGSRLACGGGDGQVRVYGADGRLVRVFSGHSGWVRAVAWDRDGRRLASGGDDATLRLWDVAAGRAGPGLKGH